MQFDTEPEAVVAPLVLAKPPIRRPFDLNIAC